MTEEVFFFNVMCSSNISLSTFADDKGISNAKLCQIILTCIVEVRVEPVVSSPVDCTVVSRTAVVWVVGVTRLIDGRQGDCVQCVQPFSILFFFSDDKNYVPRLYHCACFIFFFFGSIWQGLKFNCCCFFS